MIREMSFPRPGLRRQNYHRYARTVHATALVLLPASPSRFGGKRGGFSKTTHAVGFNSIAAIIWAAAFPKRINGKSAAGRQCERRFAEIVMKATSTVAANGARHCSTGLSRALGVRTRPVICTQPDLICWYSPWSIASAVTKELG
jgi:hypothetical protein